MGSAYKTAAGREKAPGLSKGGPSALPYDEFGFDAEGNYHTEPAYNEGDPRSLGPTSDVDWEADRPMVIDPDETLPVGSYWNEVSRDPLIAFVQTAPFPVDAAPPLVPPGVAAGAAASGAAIGGAGLLAAVVGGAWLGWWATSEVREWKRGHYKKSGVPRGYPEFDPFGSNLIQDVDFARYYDRNYFGDGFWVLDPGADFPGTGWWNEDYIFCPCATYPGTSNFRYDGTGQGQIVSVVSNSCGADQPNCGGLFISNFQVDPTVLPVDLPYYNVFYRHATLNRRVGTATYHKVVDPSVAPWQQGTPGTPVPGTGVSHFFGDQELDYDTDWQDWVAPPGTQPSGPDYQSKPQHGHVVPLPLTARFSRLLNVGYAGSVTVPDQVIDPDLGTVTVTPPGHPPDFPDPGEEFEKKPASRRLIAAGLNVVNIVTETQDAMEALHQGLPKRLRSKAKKRGQEVPPWVIAKDIVTHWDDFDAERALEALVNNEIEDQIYGRYFGIRSKLTKRGRHQLGAPGIGPSAGGPGQLPFKTPEVHFADGEFGVTFGSVTWQR